MFKQLTILVVLALTIVGANAGKILFSVVGFGSQVSLKSGSKSFSLTKYKSYVPLYRAEIDASSLTKENGKISYKYVVDNVEEPFTRVLDSSETTTHNEFYGRRYTVQQLPQFSYPDSWDRSIGRGELFDDSYIPTVHISGTRSNAIFTANNPNSDYLEKIAFILKDNVYIFKTIPCYPKNKSWNKFQFKVILNNNGIEGRYVLKFRDNNEDPTFMRQDLYGDMMTAMGYPAIQSIKTRVYVNEKAVGYYILQEEAASESFVRSAFHGKSNGSYAITDINKLGHPLDCSTGADFYYTGNGFYSFKAWNSTRYDNSRVKALAKAFEQLDVNNSSAVKKFEQQWFDIDTFFKAIAMEYLNGHWDSYWFYSTNFAVYDDPTQSTSSTYKFYFICQDWDGTFGLNLGMPYMRYDDFIKHSYKDFVNIKWGLDEYDAPGRYAIDKLLSNNTLRKRFETILTNIVRYIYNPVNVSRRLDALVSRHRPEIEWAYNVAPLRKGSGSQLNWTIKDFDTNIESASRYGASYGIKEWVYKRAKLIKEEFGINVDLGDTAYDDFSTDGTCGEGHGKCPNGQCCSEYGYCGSTEVHCGAGCQSEFGKCNAGSQTSSKKTTTTTIKKTTTTIPSSQPTSNVPVSTNGKCGATDGRCPDGLCCSKYGYCGSTSAHCDSGCQAGFGLCTGTSSPVITTTIKKTTTTTKVSSPTSSTGKVSTDGTCSAAAGRCPDGQCCSKYGYCGTSSDHCGTGCQASLGKCGTSSTGGSTNTSVSTDGTCGPTSGKCPSGLCCSKYGYCGTTTNHCGTGCQSAFGICN